MKREPALIVGLVEALLLLAVAFGLDLTAEQIGAVVAVATILGALVIRSQVTPVTGRHEPGDSGVTLVDVLVLALIILVLVVVLGALGFSPD